VNYTKKVSNEDLIGIDRYKLSQWIANNFVLSSFDPSLYVWHFCHDRRKRWPSSKPRRMWLWHDPMAVEGFPQMEVPQ
jgi:hypothetical protein